MNTARRNKVGSRDVSPCCNYLELLTREKMRCERHNHFFTFCGVYVVGVSERPLSELLKNNLRAGDYVFAMPSPAKQAQLSFRYGVLLPETGMPGAATVKHRLAQLCNAQEYYTEIGLSVYPDDGTTLEELLAKAFNDRPALNDQVGI